MTEAMVSINDEDDGREESVRAAIVLPGTPARLVTGLRRVL